MLKYSQTKMFLFGIILNKDQQKFGEFWMSLSILYNPTKLQKIRKGNRKKQIKGKSPPEPYLSWPAHLARPSRLAAPVVVLLAPEGRGARGRRPAATRRPPPASADARAALGHHVTPPRTPLVLAHSPLPWIPLFPSPRP